MYLMADAVINWFTRRPLLSITLAWISGILISGFSFPSIYILLAVIFLLILVIIKNPWYLLLFVFFISAAFSSYKREIYKTTILKGGTYTGYTENKADIYRDFDKTRWHTECFLTAKRNDKTWTTTNYKVILSGDETPPTPGNELIITAKNIMMPEPANIYHFDDIDWQLSRGISGRMNAVKIEYTGKLTGNATRYIVREYLHDRLLQAMSSNYSLLHTSLLEGIVLGAHGAPPPAIITDIFTRAGTIHILIVSGSQVALLAGIFLLPLLALPSGGLFFSYPRLRILLTICSFLILALYLIISDRGPSIDRAVLMVLLGALSMTLSFSKLGLNRSYRPDHITLLATAAFIQLLINPFLLYDPGFMLSYAAVAGMILIAPIFIRITHFLPRVLSFGLSATFGAIIATLPVLAWYFGNLPLVAPVSNLFIIPIAGLLLPIGLIAFLISAVSTTLAIPVCIFSGWLLDLLININRFMAHLPGASITFYTRSPLLIIIYFILCILILLLLQKISLRLQPDNPAVNLKPVKMW